MQSLIEVFRMTEVSNKVRANIIVKLGRAINTEYAMNITEPLVEELVYQLDAEHEIFKNELIEGADSSKILGAEYGKVIGRVNATHKEEGYANLKLITKAPQMLRAMNELVLELDKINYLLPRENEDGGNLIWDRIQTCRSIVKNVLK